MFTHLISIRRLNKPFRVLLLCLLLAGVILFASKPSVSEAGSAAVASTAGFGAAFGYAQTIGPISYTQAGSIGNGFGAAAAVVPSWSSAASLAASSGPSAAFAQSIGSPFGSAAFVQASSFWGGASFGAAVANP